MKHLTFIILLLFVSCRTHKFLKIKRGMTQNEVAKIVGRSKEIINLGPRINIYTGDTLKMEMWHYGDKEAILFVNNKVDSVLDSKKMQELGERIMGQEYSIRKRN